MNILKKLISQTAIYGLSSIFGRFLNYLLVPFITYYFTPDEYGVVTELYSYVAFFGVVLSFGMETTCFKFSTEKRFTESKNQIFNQGLSILSVLNFLFLFFGLLFSSFISETLGYKDQTFFISCLIIVIFTDAITSLPLAKLRLENKAFKFAIIHLTSIGVNIVTILFFIGLGKGTETFSWVYSEKIGVGYLFIANLLGSLIKPILLINELKKVRWNWSSKLAHKMICYATPLMIGGFAYVINETLDRAMLKKLLIESGKSKKEALYQLGIYGACYKISIVMSLFIQAFRYAVEPFFFNQSNTNNRDEIYAKVMNYFVAFLCFIFLIVTLYLNLFKYFIQNENYWEGLKVVPILLMAYIFLGIYMNQSIWYKLSGQTKFGAYISSGGAIITFVLNLFLIPWISYLGSAWVTFIVYFLMAVTSYFLGKKYYPIKYQTKKIITYIVSASILFFISKLFPNSVWHYFLSAILLVVFLGVFLFIEHPKIKFKK